MIAVDTNVLLRLVVDDHAEQHKVVKAFFAARSASDPAFIGALVMAEFSWVLTRRFGYPKERVADLALAFLASPDLIVEDADLVEQAAELARQPKIGFADALIALRSMRHGCRSIMTFDKNAAKRIPGMELLA
jgi:predicted nucleic-acid-binding protein